MWARMEQVAVVVYDDNRYDYCRIVSGGQMFYFSRTGCGGKRKDIILTDKLSADAVIMRNDTGECEAGAELFMVPAGRKTVCDKDGNKVQSLYEHAADILKQLDIIDLCDCLCEPVSVPEAERIFGRIIGKQIKLQKGAQQREIITETGEVPTVCAVLQAIGEAFGFTTERDLVAHGILKTLDTSKAVWFGETTQQLQGIGLYRELIAEDSLLYYDEVAAILYNLLLAQADDGCLLYHMVRECAGFKERLEETYERSLLYPYYEQFGIHLREKTFRDDNGKMISSVYLPGANLNHTYINEYTTADDEYFVFCAAYDNLIRKGGRGIPVLYHAKTGETVMLHDRMNMRAYGMLMSKQNVVYFVADDKIYAYDIAGREKRVIFSEPEGHELQEIPTISEDGRWLVFFYGTLRNYQPNRGCIVDTKTGNWKIFLEESWVDAHFAGTKNPFAGHFILNPRRTNLINFLHGGGKNVIDRMWLVDHETGDIWEPYVQIRKEDGSFGEELTHWIWSSDGKRLYFVRIKNESFVVESGISYIDLDESPVRVHVVDSQYFYIHAVPDAADEFFVCDTHGHENHHYKSEIILLNGKNHRSDVMYKLSILKNHPSHPHPQFSVSGKNIIFSYTPDDIGRIVVGVVNVEEMKRELK